MKTEHARYALCYVSDDGSDEMCPIIEMHMNKIDDSLYGEGYTAGGVTIQEWKFLKDCVLGGMEATIDQAIKELEGDENAL